jgi:acetylxylan esterase
MKHHLTVGRMGRALTGTAITTMATMALGAATLAAGTAPALAVSQSGTACAPATVLAARASTEAQGEGTIASLVDKIQASVSAGVTESAVVYPATLNNYSSSAAKGDTAMKAELQTLVTNCPNQKIVIVGYSQGAQLVGDVLGGGGGGSLGTATPPSPASVTSHIIAAIQFGDPRHLPNKSFNQGTATGATGLFPRPANASIDAFSAILQSYCDTGDPFCASGNNLNAHLQYDSKYDTAAAAFVKGKLNAAGVN